MYRHLLHKLLDVRHVGEFVTRPARFISEIATRTSIIYVGSNVHTESNLDNLFFLVYIGNTFKQNLILLEGIFMWD